MISYSLGVIELQNFPERDHGRIEVDLDKSEILSLRYLLHQVTHDTEYGQSFITPNLPLYCTQVLNERKSQVNLKALIITQVLLHVNIVVMMSERKRSKGRA